MRSLQLWKAIFALASIGSAQRLAFLTPSGGDPVLYTENHEIQLKWRSPWPLTTVEIWQGPRQDGSYNMKTLLGKLVMLNLVEAANIPQRIVRPSRLAHHGELQRWMARTTNLASIFVCRRAINRTFAQIVSRPVRNSEYKRNPSLMRIQLQQKRRQDLR